MCLKAGTCMSILQSFQSCPSAVGYHFPLGVRLFHSRHQKNISKGTTLLLEGSWVMLACLILHHFSALSPPLQFPTKCICSTFPFLLRDAAIWKNTREVFGLHRAGCDKAIPHSLATTAPCLCAPGVFLTLSMGMDESGSLLGSAFPLQTWTSSGAEFKVQPGSESVKQTFSVEGNVTPIQSLLYQYK